jgi:tetratricopeptide (TPR) repeat protein
VLKPLVDDPSYSSSYLAWGNLGWAQVQAGDLDAGIVSLRNAITEPRFCVGHYRLGIAFEKKGELAQAEASFSAALGVDSPDCQNLQDAWFARARVRSRQGKADDAAADLAKCREISPSSTTGRQCAKMLAPGRP